MGSKPFSQEQKLAIGKNAATIGFKEAAKIAGVHYTTVYDWRGDLKSLGKEAFLAYQPSYPDRGIKVISAEKEDAVIDCWKTNPGFGPGQVRRQLRRQAMTVSAGGTCQGKLFFSKNADGIAILSRELLEIAFVFECEILNQSRSHPKTADCNLKFGHQFLYPSAFLRFSKTTLTG